MATFIVLANWTEQGVRTFADTTKRAKVAAQEIEKAGGSMTSTYWTLGPYDFVGVMEFPDDETATAFALATGAQGNIRTTTMRAFDASEMDAIIARATAG